MITSVTPSPLMSASSLTAQPKFAPGVAPANVWSTTVGSTKLPAARATLTTTAATTAAVAATLAFLITRTPCFDVTAVPATLRPRPDQRFHVRARLTRFDEPE
jgi:hypothetical protein